MLLILAACVLALTARLVSRRYVFRRLTEQLRRAATTIRDGLAGFSLYAIHSAPLYGAHEGGLYR